MNALSFADLKKVYALTEFDADGDQGSLKIDDAEVLSILEKLEVDDDAHRAAAITVLSEPDQVKLGATVRVQIRAPKPLLGVFVKTFDNLLDFRNARIKEPSDYYVVQGRVEKFQVPADALQVRYRAALQVVNLLAAAAAYVDETRDELVFTSDSKVVIPLRFQADDLMNLDLGHVAKLNDTLSDTIHYDQKLAILETAVISLVRSQPAARRLVWVFDNLDTIVEEVRGGYRLFASSFSFAKVQGEIEQARLDFVAKIHKTVVDIQGQLLGIPVATIVVASQLKEVAGCGLLLWTNVAVLAGAWIFFLFLAIAIVNQWLTLSVIHGEISRQKKKIAQNYSDLSQSFDAPFSDLFGRIFWHRSFLVVIISVGFAGASFATYAYWRVTDVGIRSCIMIGEAKRVEAMFAIVS